MRKLIHIIIIGIALLGTVPLSAQYAVSVRNGASDPAQCQPSALNIFLNRTSGLLKLCTSTNTWASIPFNTGGTYTVSLTSSTSIGPTTALAGAGAGNVDNGAHTYRQTCVTATGESQRSLASNVTTVADKTTNGKITVTFSPCSSFTTTGRNLYRSAAGTTTPLFLISASPMVVDNTTTTYTDNTADVSLLTTTAPLGSTAFDPALTLSSGLTNTFTLATGGITFQAIAGTNAVGVPITIMPSAGTGNAAADQLNLNRTLMLASGSTVHTAANSVVICESKTLSNTSATTTTIANIALASNSAGGFHAFITLTATDATNFDSETQDVTVSYVNKAGVITVGTPLVTGTTAANNSGSATIGATVTGASPTISLKVTPVFGTIVPTTVTEYVEIHNHGAGAVTCQ